LAERVKAGAFPSRYALPWKRPFEVAIEARLRSGMSILDVGGGRHPSVLLERRPERTFYVGLDPSASEMSAAPAGSYDRMIAARAEEPIPELIGTIDLAVSWQVFEHVRSLDAVLQNLYGYLAPGGSLVSLFSGRWSAFGVINRLVPRKAVVPLVSRVGRRRDSVNPVFTAYYDLCHDSAVRRVMEGWSDIQIAPFYRGATYFNFAPALRRVYLGYENVICATQWRNAATHYLLIATR
jgi:SAM-dependent methyltransferase